MELVYWNIHVNDVSCLFVFFWTDLPKAACQNCPIVEEAPSLKTVLDAFCHHDFGRFLNSATLLADNKQRSKNNKKKNQLKKCL